MLSLIQGIRDELGKFIGVSSSLGIASMWLLLSSIFLNTRPLDLVDKVLRYFRAPGRGVFANISSWMTQNSTDLKYVAIGVFLMSLAGCAAAVLSDNSRRDHWAAKCSAAPISMVTACALAQQLELPGGTMLLAFALACIIGAIIATKKRQLYAQDSVLLILIHVLLLAFYLPVVVLLKLFGWSDGSEGGARPARILEAARVEVG